MFQLGNDAEFILVRRGGIPISAIGIVGGNKLHPLPVKLGALQEDNVLAEININPARTLAQWERNINTVIAQLKEKLPKGVVLSRFASALYGERELTDPKSKEFGCDPDYNAWTGQENSKPQLPLELNGLRSAGGHVHTGYPKLSYDAKMALIRTNDTVIGLQTVLLDKDTRRKNLYGKAGAMRFKEYGVEWRTPSNFWIFDETSRKWMFKAAMFCASNLGRKQLDFFIRQDVADIINNNDKKEALVYLKILKKAVNIPVHCKVM